MNIYKKLNNLLKTAESYQAEDLVANAFIKIAQLPEGNYDQEVVSYVARLEQTIQSQQLYLQYLSRENLQLKSIIPGLQENQTPDSINVEMSKTQVGVPVITTNPTQPVVVRNDGFQDTNKVKFGPLGVETNSRT